MQYPNWNILAFAFFILLFSPATIFAQSDSLKVDNLYQTGKDLYYDGSYEKAIKQFTKVYELQLKIYGQESEPVMKITLSAWFGKSKNAKSSKSFGSITIRVLKLPKN